MPLLFRWGDIINPGERALYKPKNQDSGTPCTIDGFITNNEVNKNEIIGYKITLDNGTKITCDCNDAVSIPKQ